MFSFEYEFEGRVVTLQVQPGREEQVDEMHRFIEECSQSGELAYRPREYVERIVAEWDNYVATPADDPEQIVGLCWIPPFKHWIEFCGGIAPGYRSVGLGPKFLSLVLDKRRDYFSTANYMVAKHLLLPIGFSIVTMPELREIDADLAEFCGERLEKKRELGFEHVVGIRLAGE
ncbi:MAG TPA: hypothetical protein VLL52_24975 [Anaerolineae bacterium]|nr:hypothetical protein [Anaerolineae bacterium]